MPEQSSFMVSWPSNRLGLGQCSIATKKALGLNAEGAAINATLDFTRAPVGSSAGYAVQATLRRLGRQNKFSL